MRPGEFERPLPDKEHVVRPFHHQAGNFRGVLDVAKRGDSSRHVIRPVHDGGIKLHDAVFVGESAVADAHVVGVAFIDVHARNDAVESIVPLLNDLHSLLDGSETVPARNDNRPPP